MKNSFEGIKLRTIKQAYIEIKLNDPLTCVTERGIRRIVKENRIPSVKIGNKTWINVYNLLAYLNYECYDKVDESDITYSSSANEEIK